jgi:hypothetical protein
LRGHLQQVVGKVGIWRHRSLAPPHRATIVSRVARATRDAVLDELGNRFERITL